MWGGHGERRRCAALIGDVLEASQNTRFRLCETHRATIFQDRGAASNSSSDSRALNSMAISRTVYRNRDGLRRIREQARIHSAALDALAFIHGASATRAACRWISATATRRSIPTWVTFARCGRVVQGFFCVDGRRWIESAHASSWTRNTTTRALCGREESDRWRQSLVLSALTRVLSKKRWILLRQSCRAC